MMTPVVAELPRQLEPVVADPFIDERTANRPDPASRRGRRGDRLSADRRCPRRPQPRDRSDGAFAAHSVMRTTPGIAVQPAAPASSWQPRLNRVQPAALWREPGAVGGLLRLAGNAVGEDPGAGNGPPVLLVPGFLAGDRSLQVLATHLTAAGYQPWPAGISCNVDCSEATATRLLRRLERAAVRHGGPVAIVGHSRGGMLARVLARRRPDLVSGVFALATPHRAPLALHPPLLANAIALGVAGSAGVAGLVRRSCAFGSCCADFRAGFAASLPSRVGYLSIYSRDGIVDWRACLDPAGRHVEVMSSHCGMVADPVTLHVILGALEGLRHLAARRRGVTEAPAGAAAPVGVQPRYA